VKVALKSGKTKLCTIKTYKQKIKLPKQGLEKHILKFHYKVGKK
jgi:hypothetical protein